MADKSSLEELRTEEEAEIISLVVKCNLKGKYKDISNIRTEVVAEDLEKYYYDANFMSKLFCIFDTILLAPVVNSSGFRDANAHITDIFQDLRRIGAESVNGVALMSGLGSSKDLFVIKAPKDPSKDQLFHELFVGVAATNSLRKLIPNYAYIFGGFKCLPPTIAEDKKVIAWCERSQNTKAYVNYVIYEKIPGKSLADYIKTCSFDEFFGWFVQIVLAIQIGVEKCDFTHYDLHDENVMLRDSKGTITIPYKVPGGATWWLQTNHAAVLIDFGMSHVKVNGRHFGPFGFESYGVFSDQSRPLYDIYKLIGFSFDKMRTDNRACFEQALPLLQLIIDYEFKMSPDELEKIIKEEYDDYYTLSNQRSELEDEYSLWDYLNDIKKTYPELWRATISLTPQEGAEPLSCMDSCPTPGQFEEEITMDAPTQVKWHLHEVKKNPNSIDSKIAMSELPGHIRQLREDLSKDFARLSEQLEILNSQSLQGIPDVMSEGQFNDFYLNFVEPHLDFRAHHEVYLGKLELLEEYYAKKGGPSDVSEFQFGHEIKTWQKQYAKVRGKLNRIIVPASDEGMQESLIDLMRT